MTRYRLLPWSAGLKEKDSRFIEPSESTGIFKSATLLLFLVVQDVAFKGSTSRDPINDVRSKARQNLSLRLKKNFMKPLEMQHPRLRPLLGN